MRVNVGLGTFLGNLLECWKRRNRTRRRRPQRIVDPIVAYVDDVLTSMSETLVSSAADLPERGEAVPHAYAGKCPAKLFQRVSLALSDHYHYPIHGTVIEPGQGPEPIDTILEALRKAGLALYVRGPLKEDVSPSHAPPPEGTRIEFRVRVL